MEDEKPQNQQETHEEHLVYAKVHIDSKWDRAQDQAWGL